MFHVGFEFALDFRKLLFAGSGVDYFERRHYGTLYDIILKPLRFLITILKLFYHLESYQHFFFFPWN